MEFYVYPKKKKKERSFFSFLVCARVAVSWKISWNQQKYGENHKKPFMLSMYVMICAIWYHLCNLKKSKLYNW